MQRFNMTTGGNLRDIQNITKFIKFVKLGLIELEIESNH